MIRQLRLYSTKRILFVFTVICQIYVDSFGFLVDRRVAMKQYRLDPDIK